MIKILTRLIVTSLIIGEVVALFSPFSFSKSFEEIKTLEDWVISMWIAFSAVGGFFWWIYMFYHWWISQFQTKGIKRFWFWFLFLGTMLYLVGPIVYYIAVFEMGNGLVKRKG